MKTLKGILEQSKMHVTPDTERFIAKHAVKVTKPTKAEEDDNLFNAKNIKTIDRETQHGYNPGSDEAVYEAAEQVDEKHLTPAEMKKREQVAKAMERSNPGMDKSKKMAIATATAKRVAEEVESLEEGEEAHAQFQKYHKDTADLLKNIHSGLAKHYDAVTDERGYNKGQAHWGHVGDIKSIHRQLQDLHDQILQHGEYAKPAPAVMTKESIDESTDLSEDQYSEIIDQILEGMSEDERAEFFEILETDEGAADIVAMIDEVLSEQSEE